MPTPAYCLLSVQSFCSEFAECWLTRLVRWGRYVNLDDCWQAEERDANGHLVSHPENFPSGIKALAKYAHDKGIKLGLYTAMGNGTCANDNGRGVALGLGCDFGKIPTCSRAKQDIEDFVSWDIDHLKVKSKPSQASRAAYSDLCMFTSLAWLQSLTRFVLSARLAGRWLRAV